MVNDVEERGKRVLGIMASILVASSDADGRLAPQPPSPRTESLVGSAVQWAERTGVELTAPSQILRVTKR